MKNKKSVKHQQGMHLPPKEIVMPHFHKHLKNMNKDEESKIVRVFFSTGNHRHPVQYWRLIRKRNTTNK
jgi:hypothetical protein